MNYYSRFCFALVGISLAASLAAGPLALPAPAQNTNSVSAAPTVDRVEPPNWWVGAAINPIRVLMHGKNLTGAQVRAVGTGLSAKSVRVSADGSYVFADLVIGPKAAAGVHSLRVTTAHGSVTAPFALSRPLSVTGRFQGFSPDDVVYQIMPDRFSDGDSSNNEPKNAAGLYGRSNPHLYHGGDFQGIIDHLPYLKDLGVTALWITPIYENIHHINPVQPGFAAQYSHSDYHGYGAINQYGVEPHFGDMASLRRMVERAHALGIKVIQDQVANHVGPHHPWAGDPPTPTWFNGTVANHLNNTYQIWTVTDPHATSAERASTLGGWFANALPDLNQDDPEVARYEIQNTLWWVGETGFDGIREDTMPYVPRSFWQQWNAALQKKYPHLNAVGEVFDGDVSLVSYFQGGRVGPDGINTGMDALFDYPLYFPLRRAFAQGASFHDMVTDEAHDWLFPRPQHLMTFLGNHDVKRFLNEDGATAAGLMLAQTFLLTNRGIPLLYYGDEIGMTGGDDPDNRRDFPGGFPGDTHNAFTSAARTPQEQEIWQHVRALTHLRAELAPLRRGSQKTLYQTDKQWAYARLLKKDVVLVVLNNDTAPATFIVPVAAVGLTDGIALTDRLGSAGTIHIVGGSVTVTLPARGGAVFTR